MNRMGTIAGRPNSRMLTLLPLAILAAVAIVALTLTLSAADAEAQTPTPLKPNLQAQPARDFHLETTQNGDTLLRFSTTSWNSGAGPLELVPKQILGSGDVRVWQRIYDDAGGSADVDSGVISFDDGHNHFHFKDYATYRLLEDKNGVPGVEKGQGNKTTFCIMDTTRINHRLPDAPKRAVYRTCGADVQGMSVGWGDTYGYRLSGQSIDVTGLATGNYWLQIEIDPKNRLLEESAPDDADNTSAVLIFLNVDAGIVELVGGDKPGNGNGNGGCNPNRPNCPGS